MPFSTRCPVNTATIAAMTMAMTFAMAPPPLLYQSRKLKPLPSVVVVPLTTIALYHAVPLMSTPFFNFFLIFFSNPYFSPKFQAKLADQFKYNLLD